MNLSESAARCGASCWIERRVFEVFGGWSRAVAGAEATLVLDRHSLHAAWRADQWWDRLPVLADVDRDALVAAPARWQRLLGGAGSPAPGDDSAAGSPAAGVDGVAGSPAPEPGGADVALLAVAYRVVLPRLVAGYRAHQSLAGGTADGPVLRALCHVVGDARRDWEEGEALLQSLLVTEDAVAAAAGTVSRSELALLDGTEPAVSV